MKLLVTGGAGFIGSHLLERLVARGDSVTVLDAFDIAGDVGRLERNLLGLRDRIDLVVADLCDAGAVARSLEGVEVVVHLAAQTGVRRSLEEPSVYARSNVEGTAVLLEQMRRARVNQLVFASSSSVYGARSSGPFAEDEPLGPLQSPYAASKRAGEDLVELWHQLYGVQTTVLRFFTVYGPRQRPEMAIHRFARMLLSGESLPVFGDGSSCRDYTFVADIVEGLVAAIDRPQPFAVINLGNRSPVRLDDLVAALGVAVGCEPVVDRLPSQPGDVPMTWADTRRAERLLGYTPNTPLGEGLVEFVAWLRAEVDSGN